MDTQNSISNEFRPLSDEELDQISGGAVPLIAIGAAAVLGTAVGIGAGIASYWTNRNAFPPPPPPPPPPQCDQ